MKPYIHAQSSAKQFGGEPEDYLELHNWFDQTKSHFADLRHRAILHTSFGIFLAEQVFGVNITNSKGKKISTRALGEQHVLEDFRGRFIPTVQDYLENLEFQSWMNNGNGYPPSERKLEPKKKVISPIHTIPPTPEPPNAPLFANPEDIVYDGTRAILDIRNRIVD